MPPNNLQISLLGEFQLSCGCVAPAHEKGTSFGRVPWDAANEPSVTTARLQALLAYLLLHRQAPQSRAHLAFLFWPDTNEAQALTNLRNLLYKLRHALPDAKQLLRIDNRTVQWEPDVPVALDVAAFEEAVAQATTATELAHAADLYHGDLLPNCYDEWIQPERERLRQLALNTLERLLDLLEAERNYRDAIRYGRRLLQFEPFNEAVYRRLMNLYAADADRAGALHTYQRCVAMLQEEFGATPDPTTEEIYQRLQDSVPQAVPTATSAQEIPLIGRLKEWQQLRTCWVQTASGKTHCLLLTGEAGIGKTRLAEELLGWVESQGFLTATAHCYAAEGALAYAPVTTWLRTPAVNQSLSTLDPIWVTEVARLLPDLLTRYPHLTPPGALTAGWQRQRFFEALARTLLYGVRPRLLLIDDLQWCDRDTLTWLHYLLRFGREHGGAGLPQTQPPTGAVLLVGTVRSEALEDRHPLHELLGALRHDDALTELALTGLTATETTELANRVAGQPFTTAQSAQIYRETEGNPLFVVEMVRAGMTQEGAEWPDGNSEAPLVDSAPPSAARGSLPPKVHAVIHARLAELSPATRTVAALAATIGRDFSYAVLAHASHTDDETLVTCLDELCQRRIVRERSADRYDFTHDKLREVTYNSLSAARRRLAHRAVAEALEAVSLVSDNGAAVTATVSGQIASHYELAGSNERAIRYYQQAAAAAHQISANDDAVRAYQRALALVRNSAPNPAATLIPLYEQLGDLLRGTGQYAEARANFAQALAHVATAGTVTCATLHGKIGSTWREQYQYAQAMQFYHAALRALNSPIAGVASMAVWDDAQDTAWWQAWLQIQLEIDLVHYWLAETDASALLHQELQPLIEEHGTVGQQATFFQRRAQLELRRHRSVATVWAVAYARRALALYEAAGMAENLPAAHFMLGFLLLWYDEFVEATGELTQALTAATQSGDRSLQARTLTYLAIAARRRNQLDESAQWAAQALTVATAAHMPEYIALARANQAWLAWRQHDLSAVREHGRVAQELWQQLPVAHASAPFQWTALWPLLATALAGADLAVAVDCGRALLDPHQQQLPAPLATPLTGAIQQWDAGEGTQSAALLNQAVMQAQQLHYL